MVAREQTVRVNSVNARVDMESTSDSDGRLWLSPDKTQIAASNTHQMKVWDRVGNLLWATTTKQPITSMHFAGSGKSLLVGVGNQLRVFDAAGYRTAMPWKSERYVRLNRPTIQFDDAIELPSGGHIFAVIHEDIRTMHAH